MKGNMYTRPLCKDECEESWTQYETLLTDAVKKKHYLGVKKLLEFKSSTDSSKETSSCPLILAIERKNVPIIQLLRKHDYTIPELHYSNCACLKCKSDKLGKAMQRLSIVKTLSNPVWIALVATDPFLTVFKLSHLNRERGYNEECFQMEYDEIYNETQKFCVHLLDEVRSEREGAILMRYDSNKQDGEFHDLKFINMAVENEQKTPIAHSVIQHFLVSAVFDEVPQWEMSGLVYKAFLVFFVGLIWPITTCLNIFIPERFFPALTSMAMKPFVKFINGAASFITFLILLSILGALDRDGIRTSQAPCRIEVAVFVWLIGFCYGECRQIYKNGVRKYLSNGWNWVDLGMDSLMMVSFVIWTFLYCHPIEDPLTYDMIMYIADGTFAMSIVLSFFRIIYLCQITSYLGLLQLCLGEMIVVILQFTFICLIVLLSFTVAMSYLFNASRTGQKIKYIHRTEHLNETGIYRTFSTNFNGFWATLFTMIYVSLTVEDTACLEDFKDGTLIQLWANILFIVYFGITMIIVLNMLIAMMNNHYENIAQNIVTENMYSRTKLWMEYIGDEQTLPVPFNLLIPLKAFRRFVRETYVSYFRTSARGEVVNVEDDGKEEYKKLCAVLTRRYLCKVFETSDYDEEPPANLSEDDCFLKKVNSSIEKWKGGCCDVAAGGHHETSFSEMNGEKRKSQAKTLRHDSCFV